MTTDDIQTSVATHHGIIATQTSNELAVTLTLLVTNRVSRLWITVGHHDASLYETTSQTTTT